DDSLLPTIGPLQPVVLLGVGTTYRPPAPEQGVNYAEGFGADGLWGWHEYTRHPELLDHTAPFMAWAHLPTREQKDHSILYRRASRQDCAPFPDEAVEGNEKFEGRKKLTKRKLGMGTTNGMYRLTDNLYEDLKRRYTTLREHCDLATRLLTLASKECMDGVSPNSIIRVILANVREPVREYLDIAHACERLRYGRIAAFQEFDVCFTAYQRAHNVMLAYFDFACSILPPSVAPGLAELPKLTSSEHRRGVVLAGEDIKTYIRFFKAHHIPIWVYAAMDTILIPAGKLAAPDPPRCDVSRCAILNNFKQRSLPLRWYPPPPHCLWAMIEPIGRGYVPRPDQDSFELGQEAQKKKKRLEGALKREQEIREANERKLENLKMIFGDLGSSLDRYRKMAARSPAAQRYFASKIKPRPTWAPPITSKYMVALDGAMGHIDFLTRPLHHPIIDTRHPNFYLEAPKIPRERLDALLEVQRKELVLRTWVPPLSVFTNPTNWAKTVELVCNAVTLLPVMLQRILVARYCGEVQPLSTAEWRDILMITHWKGVWHDHNREKYIEEKLAELRGEDWDEATEAAMRKALKGDKIPLEPYNHDEYDKYGSVKFFGRKMTDNVIASLAPEAERWNFSRGDLACKHPATKERLVEDPDLVHNILVWFERLALMFWLSDLNSEALARDGIPASAIGWRHTPDFTAEGDRGRPTVKLIMQAVLRHQVVDTNGWPAGGEEADDTFEAPEDFRHLAQLLIGADHAHFVDQYMERELDWYTVQDWKDLMHEGGEPFGSAPNAEFDAVEEQLHLRYILTSFAARQWPVEMTRLPGNNLEQYKCVNCRPPPKSCERRDDDVDAATALSVALGAVLPAPHPHLGDAAPKDTGMDVRFEYEPDSFWQSYDGHLSDEPAENEGLPD
ncbi:unnamed protein product, partial [Peniophora sp. CBMAI 1063]